MEFRESLDLKPLVAKEIAEDEQRRADEALAEQRRAEAAEDDGMPVTDQQAAQIGRIAGLLEGVESDEASVSGTPIDSPLGAENSNPEEYGLANRLEE